MITNYTRKLIIAGEFVELYEYSGEVWRGFDKPPAEIRERLTPKQRTSFSIARTRNNIRRIINANPELNKFLTLTFSKNQCDVKEANYEFKKFIGRFAFRYLPGKIPGNARNGFDLKYIAIVEFQRRGAVHYHVVNNFPFVEQKEMQKIWGNGIVDIRRMNECDNIGAYVSKYLNKGIEGYLLYNHKKYFCSRNLVRPREIVDDLKIGRILRKNAGRIRPTFTTEFSEPHIGYVKYTQFRKVI